MAPKSSRPPCKEPSHPASRTGDHDDVDGDDSDDDGGDDDGDDGDDSLYLRRFYL